LFERILSLSAPGSWLASNVPGEGFSDPDKIRRQREDMERIRAAAANLIGAEITDADDLWYPEKRTPVDSWLREHGWDVLSLNFPELLARYHRSIPPGAEDSMPPTQFISAHTKA
jgi:O-methyltransferase involved in polyketide biosynthesis